MAELSSKIDTREGDSPLALPFSKTRQEAVMGYLLTRESFFLQCKDRLLPNWFMDNNLSLIYQSQVEWFKKFNRFPGILDVQEWPLIRGETQQKRNFIRNTIDICVSRVHTKDFALEPIIDELTKWLRARIMMNATYSTRDYFNRQQVDAAFEVWADGVKKYREASFNEEKVCDFSDITSIVTRRQTSAENALTFGLSLFDKLLLPEGKGRGSLLPASSTVVIAPTNVGKSAVLTTVACANMALGKRVLFVPHEGDENEIKNKFLCCLLDRNLSWLTDNLAAPPYGKGLLIREPSSLSPEELKIVKYVKYCANIINKNLVLMPMIRAGLTVEEVVTTIRRKHEEYLNLDGKGFQLVCDDYPAKLTTVIAQGGKAEPRHTMQHVYLQLYTLAEELKFHLMTAAQGNREASKINKKMKGHESRLLELEDIGEAFGPVMDAPTVITINRDSVAENQNRISLHCAKSRTGIKGWTVVCRSKYENYISHGESLGATWYKGGAVGSERLDNMIDLYRGTEIPFEADI